jgi:hypothetical protein
MLIRRTNKHSNYKVNHTDGLEIDHAQMDWKSIITREYGPN